MGFFDCDQFMIIGHRGIPSLYPENTMSSFIAARNASLDAIEFDLQLSIDKTIVIFHDYDMMRLTGMEKHPWNYTSAELKTFKILGSNEGIPLLSEIFENFQNYKLMIELKTLDDDFNRVNNGIEKIVIDMLKEYKIENVSIVSFNPIALRNIKKLNPSIPVGWNIKRRTEQLFKKPEPAMMKKMNFDFLQFELSILTDKTLKLFEGTGIPILVWDVDDIENARKLKDKGVKGIITNRGNALTGRL